LDENSREITLLSVGTKLNLERIGQQWQF